MKRAVVIALIAGCTNQVDPAWQLDHDRVIAVRITPPRIVSGETADVVGLIGRKADSPIELAPDTAMVVSPTSLASALQQLGTRWIVTAPPADKLATARAELGLAADAPVPLRLKMTFAPSGLVALKNVWLGEHTDNPVLEPITINGTNAASASQLGVMAGVDIPVAVDFDNTHTINWLTSCGTMHDFDLAKAYLRVEPVDPHSGYFAVVVRDANGGATWHVWPITAVD